jgi:hypothetical protein
VKTALQVRPARTVPGKLVSRERGAKAMLLMKVALQARPTDREPHPVRRAVTGAHRAVVGAVAEQEMQPQTTRDTVLPAANCHRRRMTISLPDNCVKRPRKSLTLS